jgi:hypothetical protein
MRCPCDSCRRSGQPLARFRADPAKVRVTVRRTVTPLLHVRYVVTIVETGSGFRVSGSHPVPRSAILRALLAAEAAGIEGIDLAMGSTYPHPHRTGGSFERSEHLH